MDIRKSSLITTIAAAGLMFVAGNAMAYTAKPIYVRGSAAGSFVNTTFAFEEGPDSLATELGYDNLGGQSLSQVITEYYDADETCTATDGTIGEVFYLHEGYAVISYAIGGQLYTFADEGSECASLTTGVFSGSGPFYIIGGSGRFADASGTAETNFSGQFLDTPAEGFFGSVQQTNYGTVTP
ncbi:MAG TPA: hypothetical protein VMU41_12685 [Candidatus Binataceae bacterium]|nr:hypothetical protein [Candidatus Binataceae bacterium]